MNPENQDSLQDIEQPKDPAVMESGPEDTVQEPAGEGEPEENKQSFILEAYEWVETLLAAMLMVVLLFTFVGRTVIVDGPSMLPTLHDRDALIVTRLTGDPKPGDIVAVTKLSAIDRPLIKRVIAVGGQTIRIDGATGDVYVDGELLEEAYINEHINPDLYLDEVFPLTVPENTIFIMGDNRNNSWDSRSTLGVVDKRHVLGKVVFRYMPFDQIGTPK